ncbi:MAG: biotin--[acetyl-CoA-carboxylase] ligase [Halobacteriales archaeon]|nr:biotin--[acetyl-CoA-carboxylase] ligase [Halobacteriales archaeon]
MSSISSAALLRALTAGDEPVAVETLADRLSSTVGAVEDAIGVLEASGFDVDRTGAGIRIDTVPAYGLGVQYGLAAPFSIEYHDRLASTNDRARELARTTAGEWAVLADRQTGGRGRRDRRWTSPTGGIWCSVLLRPTLSSDRASLLTLAAAVAVTDAVREAGVQAAIKWPNDVLAPDGGKLAGILLETASSGASVSWAIIGLGLNAAVDPAALPADATSLQAWTDAVDRRSLTQSILEGLDDLRHRLDTVPDAWRDRSTTLDRRVRIDVDADTGSVIGRAVDIDATGALLLETDQGRRRITVGDCEHLRPV